MEYKIEAIVVTHNRKILLQECLQALEKQTYSLYKIIVVDNASSDGTIEMLKALKEVYKVPLDILQLNKNIGGSGGFYEGMKYARDSHDADYVWIMDDDTIPEHDALEYLINAAKLFVKNANSSEKASYFVSTAFAENHKDCMNVPELDTKLDDNGYPSWTRYLKYGLVKTTTATFVSIMFPIDVLDTCGLPVRDFFIWCDDTEYTLRLQKYYGSGYLVGKSKVIHKRLKSKSLSLATEENQSRIKMYYYLYRNRCICDLVYRCQKNKYNYFLICLRNIFPLLFMPLGWLKFKIAYKGIFNGCFKNNVLIDFINSQINSKKL